MNDVCVYDKANDTLIQADMIKATIKKINTKSNLITLKSIELDGFTANIKYFDKNENNYQFLFDSLSGTDTSKAAWSFRTLAIKISDASVAYANDYTNIPSPGRMNYNYLTLNDLNLDVSDINLNESIKQFRINHLTFNEVSGFDLSEMQVSVHISNDSALITDLGFITPDSRIMLEKINLYYDSLRQVMVHPEKLLVDASITDLVLSSKDLSYFIKPLDDTMVASFQGNINGGLSDFTATDIKAGFGNSTFLKASFKAKGIQNLSNSHLVCNIDTLWTNTADVRHWMNIVNDSIRIPKQLYGLDSLRFSGNFQGNFNDFVSRGQLISNEGSFRANLTYKPDSFGNNQVSGKITIPQYDLGEIFNNGDIGVVSLITEVSGVFNNKEDFNIAAQADIPHFFYNDYTYRNIDINGVFSNRLFDGKITVNDPLAHFNFEGVVDLASQVHNYNFIARSEGIDLEALNLADSTVLSTASFDMDAYFSGNRIDNVNGQINLNNAVLEKGNKRLTVNNIKATSRQQDNKSQINITSDFIEGSLSGKFNIVTLSSEIWQVLGQYFPIIEHQYASAPAFEQDTVIPNDFQFAVNLKNPDPLTSFFLSGYSIDKDAAVKGYFNRNENNLSIELHTGFIKLNQYFIDSLNYRLFTRENNALSKVYAKNLRIDDDLQFEDIEIRSVGHSDTLETRMAWKNDSRLKNEGEIYFNNYFYSNEETNNIIYAFDIIPSAFFFDDNEWIIEKSYVTIDSNAIKVPQEFRVFQSDKHFSFRGSITENMKDTAFFDVKNINISKLNALREKGKYKFYGDVSSRIMITHLYHEPVFTAAVAVEDFTLNDEYLGKVEINGSWNNRKQLINLSGNVNHEDTSLLDLHGIYVPEGKKIDLAINLTGLPTRILDPLLERSFSDFKGDGKGMVYMKGELPDAMVNGSVYFENASFVLDPLQTEYHFTHEINVNNNVIHFNQVDVFDKKGNKAIVNGEISLNDFRNVWIDLNIDADNFYVLNTMPDDSPEYYGQAYGTGVVNINGPGKELTIDISANTENNTVLYIPLNASEEIEENDFLTFVEPTTRKEEIFFEIIENDEARERGKAEINMDIEVLDNAQVQLIFDPKIGDVLRARGNGNINLSVSREKELEIYGDYEITEGNYLFTLQNVINKRFNVEQGSRVSFNGDINNSQIDIAANYDLKTQLYDLVAPTIEDEDKIQRYRRRIPVRCHINLGNNLYNPSIAFDITLPNAEEETRVDFRNALNKGVNAGEVNSDQLTKQFLSLMVINQFLPNPNAYGNATQVAQTGGLGYKGAAVTTSELLSNQFSSWLSQISDEFDVGFNYMPGDEITKREIELALSTQVLNDRVTINGNLDMVGNQTQESNIVGDFDVEYKITESGKLRLKAYHHSNDRLVYDYSPHTQGVGIFYREDFNSFGELFRMYWNNITKKDTLR